MIHIYHNPRCQKSREGLEKVKQSGKEYTVREYLKEPLSRVELQNLIKKLDISPSELIRKNEKIWKEQYRGKEYSEDEIIDILVQNPKLIERPIVEINKKAVIGRPPERIDSILQTK